MTGPPVAVEKEYPARGPLQQFPLEQSLPSTCIRCGQDKKSKLQSLYRGDWSRTLCNGCYGRLLSVYEIQAGTEPMMLSRTSWHKCSSRSSQLQMPELHCAGESTRRDPEQFLTGDSLRFLGSAEYLASTLEGQSTLEWSGAIIGLCKAAERELLARFLQPLQRGSAPEELAAEFQDPVASQRVVYGAVGERLSRVNLS
jgi:hypothetical protein